MPRPWPTPGTEWWVPGTKDEAGEWWARYKFDGWTFIENRHRRHAHGGDEDEEGMIKAGMSKNTTKKDSIAALGSEFKRGEFSIKNIIKKYVNFASHSRQKETSGFNIFFEPLL